MTIDVLALANEAAATGPDQTVATKGGGEGYTPPAAGPCMARLVGYIETGVHERSVGAGKPKVQKPQVQLIFELFGPKHPPREINDVLEPVRLKEDFNASPNYGPLNEKSGLYKLFKRMNYEGKAKHMSQLLGQAFLVTVVHTKKGDGPEAKVFAGLRDVDGGYQVSPPRQLIMDPVSGEAKENVLSCDPARSPLRLFLWNAAPDIIGKLWDTLFIDGEYPERTNDKGEVTAPARSKNVFQNTIKDALNFKGSPIFDYLQTKGVALNLGAAGNAADGAAEATVSAPPAAQVASDPLAGVN